jgi:uncharacterized membrane protein YphA (DoxX/SURF4 family)
MAPAQEATGRCAPWPKDALRVSFGIIWLIDAVLKWLPGFRSGYMDAIMGEAQGQPGWLKPWFDFWISFQHPRVTVFAYLVAIAETLIALALIAGFARKLTYLSAIVFSLLIWGDRGRVRWPVHLRCLRHRHRGHLRGRVRRPAGAELLRRAVPLQRRLLHREEDQLVVEDRRDAPPYSG